MSVVSGLRWPTAGLSLCSVGCVLRYDGANPWEPSMQPHSVWRAALAVAVLALLALRPSVAAEEQTLEIVTRSGVYTFTVELAVTDEERSKGLMFRRELPEGRGMPFDFKQDVNATMWMKNTYIPLDMIFIRADGRIQRIAENSEPQ